MSETKYTIKALRWMRRNDGAVADSVFGEYGIARKWTGNEPDDAERPNGPWFWYLDDGNERNDWSEACANMKAGKAAAEAHYRAKLIEALEPV